jgi:hypothetical protein
VFMVCCKPVSLVVPFPAGLIFGCSSASMLRLPLGAFVDLGGATVAEALLGEGQSKGAIKTGTTTGIKLGPVKKLAGRHTDGDPLALMVQVRSFKASFHSHSLLKHHKSRTRESIGS